MSTYDPDVISDLGVVKVSATAPANPITGDAWFDTAAQLLKIWDGSAWQPAATVSGSSLPPTSAAGQLIVSGSVAPFAWQVQNFIDQGRY